MLSLFLLNLHFIYKSKPQLCLLLRVLTFLSLCLILYFRCFLKIGLVFGLNLGPIFFLIQIPLPSALYFIGHKTKVVLFLL